MNSIFNIYWQISLALTFGSVLFYFIGTTTLIREREKLATAYWILVFAFSIPVIIHMLPKQLLFDNPLNLELGQALHSPLRSQFPRQTSMEFQSVSLNPVSLCSDLKTVVPIFFITLGFLMLVWSYLILLKRSKSLMTLRRFGNFSLKVEAQNISPYAAHLIYSAYVAVPESVLLNRNDFRSVLEHEFHHLRMKDTLWAYVLLMIKYSFLWNPIVFRFVRRIEEQQEFACDEALIGRGVSTQAYGQCLWQVAAQLHQTQSLLVGTTSMFLRPNAKLLKRRIEMLTRYKKSKSNKLGFSLAVVGTLLCLGATSLVGRVLAQNSKISMIEAQKLAKESGKRLGIPIEVDDELLHKLNQFIGTESGKKFFNAALERKKEYEVFLSAELKSRGLPRGLLAIPLIESGFSNLSGPLRDGEFQKNKDKLSSGFNLESDTLAPGYRGAGLWMFIPETARNYGLVVNQQEDQRMNIKKSTSAALQLLSDLKKEFGDWALAVAAYNHGSKIVRSRIEKYGTNDAWELARKGALNNYLRGVAAGMIVMDHPELLN